MLDSKAAADAHTPAPGPARPHRISEPEVESCLDARRSTQPTHIIRTKKKTPKREWMSHEITHVISLTQLQCMPVDPDLAIQSPGVESVLPFHVKSFDLIHPRHSGRISCYHILAQT